MSRGAARSESTEADAPVMDCVFERIRLSPENGERSAERLFEFDPALVSAGRFERCDVGPR
jgi:hypothetical protein